MKVAGKGTRNTFYKTRLTLFVRTYAGYSMKNYLISKYRIDSNLPKSQLKMLLWGKRTIPEISKLSKVLILDYQQLWRFVVLNKRLRLNPSASKDEKIKVYLAIENEMAILKVTRQDKEDIIHEDYERAMLSPAIERVAGNSLRNIRDDLVFEKQLEELRKKYQRWYYEIAHEYKLPTLVNSPFILSLIGA